MIIANIIAIIVANLSAIIPFNTINTQYEQIAIIIVAIIGFTTNFENVKFSFIFLLSTFIAIVNATKWHATEPIAAPFAPIHGIGTNIVFNINLVITPHPNANAGTITLPKPCNAPFMVWSNIVNIIVNALICNITAPAFAFGNSKFNIGCANIHIPIVQGKPINIETNSENEVLFVAVFVSFFALAAAIAGTKAVANAIFIESGKLVRVSTFPLNIPYCIFASASGKNSFSPLTTVNESIFLFSEDIIADSAIGIDTNNIFLTIIIILSFLIWHLPLF